MRGVNGPIGGSSLISCLAGSRACLALKACSQALSSERITEMSMRVIDYGVVVVVS